MYKDWRSCWVSWQLAPQTPAIDRSFNRSFELDLEPIVSIDRALDFLIFSSAISIDRSSAELNRSSADLDLDLEGSIARSRSFDCSSALDRSISIVRADLDLELEPIAIEPIELELEPIV